MIAIIKTGGKQYKVKAGDILKIEKLPQASGKEVVFDKVLLMGNVDGQEVKFGQPLIKGAKVKAQILEQGRAKKVKVVKYKPKTRYTRVLGHRQSFTRVKISELAS